MTNDRGLLSILGLASCPNRTFFNYCNFRMTFSKSAFVAWSAWDFLLLLFVDEGSLASLDLSVEEYLGFQNSEDAWASWESDCSGYRFGICEYCLEAVDPCCEALNSLCLLNSSTIVQYLFFRSKYCSYIMGVLSGRVEPLAPEVGVNCGGGGM